VVYSVPLREDISVEQARTMQAKLNSGELSSEDIMENYAEGVGFVQPGQEKQVVGIDEPAPELIAKPFWQELFSGVTEAQAVSLEFSSEPEPTPTPIPTLSAELTGGIEGIPDPRITNPELFDLTSRDAPIPQFVNAMKMAGIEISAGQVSQGLVIEELKDINNNPFLVATYNLDPDPKQTGETLEGPIPILVGEKNQENNWKWNQCSLTHLSRPQNINTSASFDGSGSVELLKNDSLVRSNFNFATIPYSTALEGDLNYRLGNAKKAGFKNFMTHVIDYDLIESMPPSSQDELLEIIKKQLIFASKTFNNTEGERIFILWNEIHPPISHYMYYLYTRYGDIDLVKKTYQMARDILGDNSTLLYNETYNYSFKEGYYENTKNIIEELESEGLIDGVGMQMHMSQNGNEIEPSEKEITEVMKNYGVPVYITEFDINQENLKGPNKELSQAEIAYKVISACVKSEVCKIIGFWGVYDGDTWLKYALNYNNPEPLPFDKNGKPKIFQYAILKALFEGLKQ